MRYISTRGTAPKLRFDAALLTGLARDGGLYVPEAWPQLTSVDLADLRGLPYADAAARIMRPFLGGPDDTVVQLDEFEDVVRDAYAAFGHPAVVPLRGMTARGVEALNRSLRYAFRTSPDGSAPPDTMMTPIMVRNGG